MKTKPTGLPPGKDPPDFGFTRQRAERLAWVIGGGKRRAVPAAYEASAGRREPRPPAMVGNHAFSVEPPAAARPAGFSVISSRIVGSTNTRGGAAAAAGESLAPSRRFALPPAAAGATTAEVKAGFTLLELLVVISIIALLAALAMPVMRNFKPNYTASASRQLLDDLARARQLAISQRTTVYMVFVETNFFRDAAFNHTYAGSWTPAERTLATNLFEKQDIGYNFVSLRSLGDQPGHPTIHYLSSWKTLPEGTFIHPAKFAILANPNQPVLYVTNDLNQVLPIFTFNWTNGIPFPVETTPLLTLAHKYVPVAYLGFDYLGRLVSGRDEIIPLTRGAITFNRGPDRKPTMGAPTFLEQPPGNTTNAYNLIYVDYITGRARALQREVK